MKNYSHVALFILGFVPLAGHLNLEAAAEVVSTKMSAPHPQLPHCVEAPTEIAEIAKTLQANSKTAFKYDGYKKALHGDSDVELAARLAYAETVAANCPKQEDRILDLVASVIGNRVRIRRGNVKDVVFQKDQFASSLNIYSESQYRAFLCPNEAELWKKALAKVRQNLGASGPTAAIPTDTVNYYLYRHSDRFKAPPWKLKEAAIQDGKVTECIRVFRNPKWK